MDESSGCSTSLPAFGVVSILFLKFIYVEREGESERTRAGEGQRERERENPREVPHCQCRARHGAQSHEQ